MADRFTTINIWIALTVLYLNASMVASVDMNKVFLYNKEKQKIIAQYDDSGGGEVARTNNWWYGTISAGYWYIKENDDGETYCIEDNNDAAEYYLSSKLKNGKISMRDACGSNEKWKFIKSGKSFFIEEESGDRIKIKSEDANEAKLRLEDGSSSLFKWTILRMQDPSSSTLENVHLFCRNTNQVLALYTNYIPRTGDPGSWDVASQWNIEPQNDGTYVIRSGSKYISASDGELTSSNSITSDEKFTFTQDSDDKTYLIQADNGKYVTCQEGSAPKVKLKSNINDKSRWFLFHVMDVTTGDVMTDNHAHFSPVYSNGYRVMVDDKHWTLYQLIVICVVLIGFIACNSFVIFSCCFSSKSAKKYENVSIIDDDDDDDTVDEDDVYL